MSQYATLSDVQQLASMPAADVAALEAAETGIVDAISTAISGFFDSKLIKRYAAPFETPYPPALVFAVARVVAYRLWLRRGYNPTGELDAAIRQDYDDAIEWLNEAANSETGLIELPKKDAALGGSHVGAGAPLSYHEASPYTWADEQYTDGILEDQS